MNLSTFLLHVKIESGAMRFSGGRSLRCFQNKDSSLVFLGTVNGELKIVQNRSKTAFEAKGRRYTTVKVIQRLFNIDLYTYLAIYRYR